ncbi:Uncharacterised protein [Cronobacter sakazakii]|nr:Uncharacterised protein [Cronobacter sakazakii]
MHHFMHRRAGVNAAQTGQQRFVFARHIGFSQQNAIGVADLRLRQRVAVHLLSGVYGVHQRDDAIQQIALAQGVIGEERLDRSDRGLAMPVHSMITRSNVGDAAVQQFQQIEQRPIPVLPSGCSRCSRC